MGLFDKMFVKTGDDGLPESFIALYKATNYTKKGYDVHYGFRCLEKLYQVGLKAVIEDKMSTLDIGKIKCDHFFPRVEDLVTIYKDGEYWYDDEDSRYFFKVCEPNIEKYYNCYSTLAFAANKLTNGFVKEYALKEETMRHVPNYFLQAGLGYSKGYLKSVDPNIKTKKIAVTYLDTAFELCCKGYGLTVEYITYNQITEKPNDVAVRALEELIELEDYIDGILSDYVKMAKEYKIKLPNDLLEKIKEREL